MTETKPYTVDLWGSHPDANNDDCWTGTDYATLAEAVAAFEAEVEGSTYCPSYTVAFVVLDGPDVHRERANPAFDPRRIEREERAERRAERREFATQQGMAFGCDGFNDAMGW